MILDTINIPCNFARLPVYRIGMVAVRKVICNGYIVSSLALVMRLSVVDRSLRLIGLLSHHLHDVDPEP